MFRNILWVWIILNLICRLVEFLLFICRFWLNFLDIRLSYHVWLAIFFIVFDCLWCVAQRLLILLTRFIIRYFTKLLSCLSLFMCCYPCNIILSSSYSKNICKIGRFFRFLVHIICSTFLLINVSFLLLYGRFILFNTCFSYWRWSFPSIHRTIIWYLDLLIAVITSNLSCVFSY